MAYAEVPKVELASVPSALTPKLVPFTTVTQHGVETPHNMLKRIAVLNLETLLSTKKLDYKKISF